MLADQWIARQLQPAQVEGMFDVPGGGGQERVGHWVVEDVVAIAAPAGREAGIEVGLDRLGHAHDDRRPAQPVDAALEPRQIDPFGRVEGDHLPPGVHAGVGSAGRGQGDLVPEDPAQRVGQRAADGGHVATGGEAVESRPVISDQQPKSETLARLELCHQGLTLCVRLGRRPRYLPSEASRSRSKRSGERRRKRGIRCVRLGRRTATRLYALPSEASRSRSKRSGERRRRNGGQIRCVRLGRRTATRLYALPSEASRSRSKRSGERRRRQSYTSSMRAIGALSP